MIDKIMPVGKRKGSTFLRMIIMVVIVLVIFGGVAFWKFHQIKLGMAMGASMKDPAQTVSTTKVAFQTWQSDMEAVGSLRAVNGVDLTFETSGIVDKINFNSGDDVTAGTVLITLRPDDTTGKLDSLEAQEKLAEIVLGRDQKQFQAQAVAQATLDVDSANLKNLKAQVAQQQALIDERVIKAPFAGHLGIRQVDLGQYVSTGTTIVTLQALDPVYVDFFLPQQSLQELKLGEQATIKIDTYPDQPFTGIISAITPKVDPATRNIQVRATVKNPQHKLLPGMYATVTIASGQPQSYLTVPQTAITFNPYGSTVYLVDNTAKDDAGKPKTVAKQTFVTTGQTRGDQIAILKGLSEGDTIITAGQTKLHNGARLAIDNSVLPASDASPTPQEQ